MRKKCQSILRSYWIYISLTDELKGFWLVDTFNAILHSVFTSQSLSCQLVFQAFRSPPPRLFLWGPAEAHFSDAGGGHIQSSHCSTAGQPGKQEREKWSLLYKICVFHCIWQSFETRRPFKTKENASCWFCPFAKLKFQLKTSFKSNLI